MIKAGLALAKLRIPLAASTASPLMKAIALGPRKRSSIPVTPASFAAILVKVFFTTAYVTVSPSVRRNSLSCATVSPRYSVSTVALEVRKWSARSATVVTFVGRAMGLLSLRSHQAKRPGAGARGWEPQLAAELRNPARAARLSGAFDATPGAPGLARPAVFGRSRLRDLPHHLQILDFVFGG